MIIKRTKLADTATFWVTDPWGGWGETLPFASQVTENDYPTHSPVLGLDGQRLKYEDRPRIGFDLTKSLAA